MESIGQRATKLPALKVGGLKKKSAASAIPANLCASAFKDLFPFSIMSKVQEADSIIWVSFDL